MRSPPPPAAARVEMTEDTRRVQPMAEVVVRGAVLMVLLRFVVRLIGLLSVVVTARLLTPADFGVVGTASLVLGLFAILQGIGVGDALVRLRRLDPELGEPPVEVLAPLRIGVALQQLDGIPAADVDLAPDG